MRKIRKYKTADQWIITKWTWSGEMFTEENVQCLCFPKGEINKMFTFIFKGCICMILVMSKSIHPKYDWTGVR